MAECKDFHAEQVYRRVESAKNYGVTAEDLLAFLRANSYEIDAVDRVTLEECRLCVEVFDEDRDGRLSSSEFIFMLLPMATMKARGKAMKGKAKTLATAEKLPFDVEYAVVRIILQEIQLQLHVEYVKKEISALGLMPEDVFHHLRFFDPDRLCLSLFKLLGTNSPTAHDYVLR